METRGLLLTGPAGYMGRLQEERERGQGPGVLPSLWSRQGCLGENWGAGMTKWGHSVVSYLGYPRRSEGELMGGEIWMLI